MIVKRLIISIFVALPVFWGLLPTSVYANVTAEMAAQKSTYVSAELSPLGNYLAVVMRVDGRRKLVVYETSTFKRVGFTSFKGDEEVGEIHWVNDERLVLKVLQKVDADNELKFFGELYAVNFDGSDGRMIYGYRAGALSTGKNRATYGWAEILDYLPNDEKHILISSQSMSEKKDKLPAVYKLNVYNGRMRNPITRAPIPNATIITDQQSNIRLAYGVDTEGELRVYEFDETWKALPQDMFGEELWALKFNQSGDALYLIDNYQQDKLGLHKMVLKTKTRKHLYTHDKVDLTAPVFSSDGKGVYAVKIDEGYPAYVVFNKKSQEAKLFKELVESFPGNEVFITSQTKDGSKSVLYVASDTSAGAYYLYDLKKGTLSLMFKNHSDVDSSLLSEAIPMTFEASDGVPLHGYFTKAPQSTTGQSAPLVVLVHGGPHGERDYWEYDAKAHFINQLGFNVLKVNYRGSGGYGTAFEKMGYLQWGSRVQQDIIEATRWGHSQEGVSNKTCIVGTSFGAYSALMSATIAPDLYQCVIATSGVYDLNMLYSEGDIRKLYWGKYYLENVIGRDEEQLAKFSPVNQVSKLKANIFIAHGMRDKRAPFEHAEELAEALDKVSKPYEWFVRKKETHGFHDEQNRVEYFKEVADFLKENLK